MPEEETSNFTIGLSMLQQKLGEGTVIIRFVAQHLHQLQQILQQLFITDTKVRERKTKMEKLFKAPWAAECCSILYITVGTAK